MAIFQLGFRLIHKLCHARVFPTFYESGVLLNFFGEVTIP